MSSTTERSAPARIRLRRELKAGTLARDLKPGTVVSGRTIQRVEHRTNEATGERYVAVFYTALGHAGRHKKAECSWGVGAVDLFEGVEPWR